MSSCPACGAETVPGQRFCAACGAALDSSAARTATSLGLRRATGSIAGVVAGPGDEARFLPGNVLAGRYRVVGLLGRGGMGEVYRADDVKLGRPVALKFLGAGLERDEGRLQRLLNEVRMALRVTHPNVCRVHDVGEVDGQHFLSMEYVDGEDLASLGRRIGRVPRDKAIQIARQLCSGLAAAHDQGILHRDLKPSNVMLDGRGQVKITDFGLAGLEHALGGPEVLAGTPAYMAPEQLAGQGVTARSDIYALGLVLYELFTGRPAFAGGSAAEVLRSRSSTPATPSSHVEGFDPAVERVILRCLETEPADRPSSVRGVIAALPGGDPLAAALAAGETPSPDLVAQAGGSEAATPLRAGLATAACLLGTAALVWLSPRTMLVRAVPLDRPAEVLQDRAETTIAELGYTERPVDRLFGFVANDPYLEHLHEHPPAEGLLEELSRPEPPAVLFGYRSSPEWMERMSKGSIGNWFRDPPRDVAGMIEVGLDTRGHLRWFRAVPPERGRGGDRPPAEPDWSVLIRAAGLDPAALREATPDWTPPVFADRRAAWTGSYPAAPEVPIRLEAAGFEGRVVAARVVEPWTIPAAAARDEAPPRVYASRLLSVVVFVSVLVGGALVGWRNVRLGRGDRSGALRFGLYLGAARLVWMLGVHHVADPSEIDLLIAHLAWSLYRVGLVWVFYLALEPYARRLWPRMLTSWVRLLRGRLRDPLVGRDLFAGLLLGLGFAFTSRLAILAPQRFGGEPARLDTPLWSFEALRGFRSAAAAVAGLHVESVMFTLIGVTMFLVLRLITRRTWIAVAAVSLLCVLMFYEETDVVPVYLASMVFFLAFFWVGLLRFGLLSVVLSQTVSELLTRLPLTFDLSAWYAEATLLPLLAVAALTVWALTASLGGRRLLGEAVPAQSPAG